MIDTAKTFNKFGYDPVLLSSGSNKIISVICDYCQKEYERPLKGRDKSNSIVDKDSCIDCRFKKREEISLKQFGVKNSAQRQDVREKISEASSERLKSDEFKEQAKVTNLAKYGNEVAMRSDIVKNIHKKVIQDKYGVDNISQVKSFRDIATKNMIQSKIRNGTIQVYDYKTRPDVAKELGFSRSHFGKLVVQYGFEEAIKRVPHISSLEALLKSWLDEEHIEYKHQFRVDNRIADFKIDNVLIELDGLYWHSDAIIEDKHYHSNKRKLYLDNGYKPLFFREYELINKFDIVKSVINNKLGKSTQVYARKCEVKEVSKDAAKDFFIANHLMGNGAGNTYGLFYDNSLISAIQIKGKKDECEISRFCTVLNISVIGGFSKLLSFLHKNILNGKSLFTFIDLRYGTGDYLTSLGFVYQHTYPSFKWTDGTKVYNRMRFPGNSGYEQGLFKLWDCGQAKFIYSS